MIRIVAFTRRHVVLMRRHSVKTTRHLFPYEKCNIHDLRESILRPFVAQKANFAQKERNTRMEAPEISLLICTLDEGVLRVPAILLPQRKEVEYVVSMQYTRAEALELVPETLKKREDVRLAFLPGRGLSRNRNHALSLASAPLCVIADDDGSYTWEAIRDVITIFKLHTEMDIALLRMTDPKGRFFKTYPERPCRYAAVPKGYYPSSLEMALRRQVWSEGTHFDARFGLGSVFLSCGEESVFLHDAMKKGFSVWLYPITLVRTGSNTTGRHFLTDKSVQRARGAVALYCQGFMLGLWTVAKEAFHPFFHRGANPLPLLWHLLQGMCYLRRTSREE